MQAVFVNLISKITQNKSKFYNKLKVYNNLTKHSFTYLKKNIFVILLTVVFTKRHSYESYQNKRGFCKNFENIYSNLFNE